MSQRVLVAYATWHGSTLGVAQKVADVLTARGADVDVKRADDVDDIGAYDAVVIGSAIRMGSVHRAARAFLTRHSPALAGKKAALFIVCLTAVKDDAKSCADVEEFLKSAEGLAPEISFLETGAFAGGYNREKSGLLVRFMFWAMRFAPGDFRNWDAITAWASKVTAAFGLAQA